MSVEAKVIWDLGQGEVKKLQKLIHSVGDELGLSQKEVKELEKSLDKMGKSGQENTKKVQNEFNNLNTVGKKVGTTLLAVFAVDRLIDYQKQIIEIQSNYQRMGAVLDTALGSRSSAVLAMTQMKILAKETPFDVKRWTEAYVQLVNRGIEPSNKALTAMGDFTSAVGKEVDQTVEAILDVSNTERWTELGVKVKSEGNKIKGTFKGITVEVDRTEAGALKMIETFGTMKGVAGAMEGISETLGGRISNLGDSFEQFFAKIGEAEDGGLNLAITTLTDLFTAMTEAMESGADKAKNKAAEMFATMRTGFSDLKTIDDYKKKIEELTEKQAALSDEFDEQNEEVADLTNIAERHNNMIGKLNGSYEDATKVVEEQRTELDKTKVEYLATEEAIKFLTRGLSAMEREAKKVTATWKDFNITTSDAEVVQALRDQVLLYEELGEAMKNAFPADQLFDDEVDSMMKDANEIMGEEGDVFIAENERVVNETKKIWDALEDHRRDVWGSLLDIAGEGFASLNQLNNNERERELEATTTNADRQIELAGDNEARKLQIAKDAQVQEEAIREQQAEAERRQFLFEQALSLARVWIKTREAIAKSIALSPLTLGEPFASYARVQGLLSAGVILAQSVQAFAEGTEQVKGPGTETSDSIHAMLSKNERVVKASHNREIGYDMSNEDLVEAAKLYKALPGELRGDIMSDRKKGGDGLDVAALAQNISGPIVKQLKNQKGVAINIDRHGQLLSVMDDITHINYLQQKFGVVIK